jgi:hypothetical protein
LEKAQTALVVLNIIILSSLKAIMEDEEEKLKQWKFAYNGELAHSNDESLHERLSKGRQISATRRLH